MLSWNLEKESGHVFNNKKKRAPLWSGNFVVNSVFTVFRLFLLETNTFNLKLTSLETTPTKWNISQMCCPNYLYFYGKSSYIFLYVCTTVPEKKLLYFLQKRFINIVADLRKS